MRRILYYFETVLIFTLIWVVLNEKADLIRIVTGIGVSFIAIFFTNYYLLLEDYRTSYTIDILSILKYFVFLAFQIYKSGISSIRVIINGDGKVKITEFESILSDDLPLCLLANAITLTPGTVTIDKMNHKLKILHFDLTDDDSETERYSVLYKFESILKRKVE